MKHSSLFVQSIIPCVLFMCGGSVAVASQTTTAHAGKVAPAVSETQKSVDTQAQPAPVAATEANSVKPQMFEPGTFEDPEVCSTCHSDIYGEWSKSMHAYAWTDKWYQPDYMLAHQQTNGATDTLCGACHAPIAARTGLLPPADGSKFDKTSKMGISCDLSLIHI